MSQLLHSPMRSSRVALAATFAALSRGAAPLSAQAQIPAQPAAQTQAPQTWNRINVPPYPASQPDKLKVDQDEYKLYLRTSDGPQQVFDFYRAQLEQQGFRVTSSKDKKHGQKAYLQRGAGSAPEDRVELDVKRKAGGVIKVEIEIDETD